MEARNFLLLLFLDTVLSCQTNCSVCTAFGINWYGDDCTATTCSKDSNSCSNLCLNCENQPNLSYCYKYQGAYPQCVSTSPSCGPATSLSSHDGFIQISDPFPTSSLCIWTLDFTKYKSSQNFVSLSFSIFHESQSGSLKILYYSIAQNSDLLKNKKDSSGTEIVINNLSNGNTFNIEDGNYFIIGYFTGDKYKNYSGMSFSWALSNDDSNKSSSHGKMTIIIISSISGFCFFCCCFCVYKIRSSIRRVRVRNLASINAERARQYEILIHNQSVSIIPDDLLELHLPKRAFDQSQDEWETKTCCICFDEYFLCRFSEGIEVRKLICKHIYHSKCIEEWFKESADLPRCPVCKTNPFNGISDNSDLLLSPQSPLLVE